MKNTPQNFIKVHAAIGIVAGIAGIATMVTGHFVLGAVAFSTGWLALWNIGNLKDQIREGKHEKV